MVLWRKISGHVCFKATGRDARRYLHNRLSNDIRGLTAGDSCLAAALNAQGRVEGLFTIVAKDGDEFLLIADGGDRATLLQVLTRFVVADRISVEDISNSTALFHFAGDVQQLVDGGVFMPSTLLFKGESARIAPSGSDLLLLLDDACELSAQTICSQITEKLGPEISGQRYDQLRWEQGVPIFPDEINDQIILLEAGLRTAVSFVKGCYVGQEVVERSDAIGKIPRALVRIALEGVSEVKAGDPILSTLGSTLGETIGKVVSVIQAHNEVGLKGLYLFALLRTGKYQFGDIVGCGDLKGVIVGGRNESD